MLGNLRTLYDLAHGFRRRYALAALLLLVGTLLLYGQPAIVGATLDAVLGDMLDQSPALIRRVVDLLGGAAFLRDNLWVAALATIACTGLGGLFTFGRMRAEAAAVEGIVRRLRDRLYDHLQRLPVSYFDKAQTGDLVQRVTSDVDTVRLFYSDQVIELLRAAALLLTVLPYLFLLDPVMALVAVAVLPVVVVFAVVFFARVRGSFKAMDEAEGAMTTAVQENLTGIRVVRAFARQDFERQKFAAKNHDHRDKHWRLFKLMAVYWASSDFLCFVQLVLVLIVGAVRVQNGDITAGTLVAFVQYVGIYLWPVRQMGRIVTELGKTTVAVGRIKEILDAPEEVDRTAAAEAATPGRFLGAVRFEHVTFAHGESVVLDDVSFAVAPGTTLGLIGPSGSGKSTVGQLLMRFYDPRSGRVTLDGVDLATLPRHVVRGQIAAVMQEPFLYGKTIAENLRVGRADAPDAAMIDAASTAAVHESVEKFERRYDTVVGERGVTLSGGQRQRVAIARALLRDAPVLILDDALSAVDTRTEAQILDALRQRRGRSTTILIAHRLSTLMHADQICVMEHGRIVQRGTHEELIAADGLYRRLWQIQTAIEDDGDDASNDREPQRFIESLASSH